jgi:hypothetical protein
MAAMHAGLPIDYFVDAVFNYPTLAELYKVAANDGLARCKQNSGEAEPKAEIDAVAEESTAATVAADVSPMAINLVNDADALGMAGADKLKAA